MWERDSTDLGGGAAFVPPACGGGEGGGGVWLQMGFNTPIYTKLWLTTGTDDSNSASLKK